jgi:DNA-binding transcriptional regulator YdaS (Cro superfamily)
MSKKSDLQRWCDKRGHGARADLARLTGLRYQTVHDLFKGTRVATVATARKIETATGGRVKWQSLVG